MEDQWKSENQRKMRERGDRERESEKRVRAFLLIIHELLS